MNHDQLLDALLALPDTYSAHVSPDTRLVAWSWWNIGPTADVYVAPTDGSAAPLRLTDTPENTRIVSWTPDSQALIVGQDHEGDERVQLFRLAIDQQNGFTPLTEAAPNAFVHGGQLHPNNRWLVYAANRDPVTGTEIEPSYVYRHDLVSGEQLALARPKKASYSTPVLNRQGSQVLYFRQDRHPAGYQPWVVGIDGNGDREVLNAGDERKVTASWLPDGERLLFLAEAGAYRRVGVLLLATGEQRLLIDDPARNIEHAYVPAWSEQPIAVVLEMVNARLQASLLSLDTGEESAIMLASGSLQPTAPLPDGSWIGLQYAADQPSDIVRFQPSDARPAAFTSLARVWQQTSIQPGTLVPAKDFRWQSVDDLAIQGWLYSTRQPSRGLIVTIHGGPTWLAEDRIDPEVQYYLAAGFDVLAPNYRGSTGFSLAYQDAIKIDGWGGREQDDIREGIRALIAAGVAAPGKVGVTGTSYGGYSSWCQITREPPAIVAAAAPICGMTDLVVDYETTRPDLRPYSEEMLGGRPDQIPERYRERSPIHLVANISGQVLIVQGMRDPNVTPANVSSVVAALEQAKVAYHMLAFEDEGHGIVRPQNQKVLYARIASFFGAVFDTNQ